MPVPDTDGIAFLEVVRAQTPRLPFILFTSEGTEQVASRAISADVTEYLIKEYHTNQWERLTRLIADAVSYYREHGDIVPTERHAKTLLDATYDMIGVVSEGTLTYVNRTGVEMLGVETRAAATHRSVEEIVATDTDVSLGNRLATIESGERSLFRTETQLLRDDGTLLPVELTATRVEWRDTLAAAIVVRDISERKEYETDLEGWIGSSSVGRTGRRRNDRCSRRHITS